MKLAVISAIHGNLLALQAVLADIARQGVNLTVNLGDIPSGPLMAQGFPTISGNHERQLLEVLAQPGPIDTATADGYAASQISPAHAAWLQALSVSLALNSDIWLYHGSPQSDLQYWLETVVPGFEQGNGPGVRAAALERFRFNHRKRLASRWRPIIGADGRGVAWVSKLGDIGLACIRHDAACGVLLSLNPVARSATLRCCR